MIQQRDIWLVPFPFSDQSGNKVRPVVVISHDAFNQFSEDVLVIGLTSQLSTGRYVIPVSAKDVSGGELRHDCYVKVENVLKISQKLVQKKIGQLSPKKFDDTIRAFESIIHA